MVSRPKRELPPFPKAILVEDLEGSTRICSFVFVTSKLLRNVARRKR